MIQQKIEIDAGSHNKRMFRINFRYAQIFRKCGALNGNRTSYGKGFIKKFRADWYNPVRAIICLHLRRPSDNRKISKTVC